MTDILIRTFENEVISLYEIEKIFKRDIIDERTGLKYYEVVIKHINGKEITVEQYRNEIDVKKAMDKFIELYYHNSN